MPHTTPGVQPIDINKLFDYIQAGDLDSIKPLVKQYKALKGWLWIHDDDKAIICAVRDAILLGNIDIVRYFIEEEEFNPDVSAYIEGRSGCLLSLISFAVKAGYLDIVKLLVEAGVPINGHIKDINGVSWANNAGIHMAIKENKTEIALYLLDKGANGVGFFDMLANETFLARAAVNDNEPLVEALIAKGASVRDALTMGASVGDAISSPVRKYRNIIYAYENQIMFQKRNKDHHLKELGRRNKKKEHHTEELAKCNNNIKELEDELEKIKIKQYQFMKLLLDHAVGMEFPAQKESYGSSKKTILAFLDDLDISGLNFVGVSVDGVPVTRNLLTNLGFTGADKALYTLNDVAALTEPTRRIALINRINQKIKQCGRIDLDGILNLVPLWQAAAIGDVNTVVVRLSAGISPNEKGKNASFAEVYPIVVAAEKGHFEVVALLANHPDIDKKDVVTAILKAKENKFLNIANYLEEHQEVNTQDKEGNTLLHEAAAKGDIDAVSKLLARGADVTITNKDGDSPLVLIAKLAEFLKESESENHLKVMRLLLNHVKNNQAYINEVCAHALNHTIKGGAVQATDLLLCAMTEKPLVEGIDLKNNIITYNAWYSEFVFKALASRNPIGLLTVLKKHGAEFNSPKDRFFGRTLLHSAISNLPSFNELIRRIQKAKDLVANRELYQSDPRHSAHELRDIANYEKRLGKNILQKDEQELFDTDPETFADELEVIYFLLDNGADASIADNQGFTPMHTLACINWQHLWKGYEQIIDRLLDCHANFEAQDKDGNTPLHCAARIGNVTAMTYLKLIGANLDVLNKNDKTPCQLYGDEGFWRALAALRKRKVASAATTSIASSLATLRQSGSPLHQKDITQIAPKPEEVDTMSMDLS
ncbi:Ankyrin repeat protein [Legionella birminghamensis]|uniref:Ankyrin repeat protein n=1 Tax=Legionella birminghamensis TaxID=28083 RepID=A0A378IBF9_9GAMM|nr:ankyrin repeat domain-containing protein [Legionella birminghamensis]KTC72551.1 Ankyrin repeat protein [Legionella birminghamensis]STX32140.1 Ankyrin repeat protein [Legionella birminghamensis]